MTKARSTKRALTLSVLSIVLCLAMLVGTTFAWFTDSVSTGVNTIMAGNLDVELERAEYDASGAITGWVAVNPAESLFKSADETLWEPGHTEYVQLRVRNAGTLALKYQFSAAVYGDENGGAEKPCTNIDGGSFKLSEYLVFNKISGAVKKIEDRTTLWLDASGEEAMMGKLDGVAEAGVLLPGASEAMTLAVYMPTSVGNAANYQTGTTTVPTIYLGLNLVATQTPSEEDSFGKDYDNGLTPAASGGVIVKKDGIEYLYTEDGEIVLRLVTADYTGDTLIIPEGVTSIGGYSFYYNSNIKNVVLPSTVTALENRAFRGTSAESITLNEGITTIGYQAFRDAVNLTQITIPSTVTTIGQEAFQKSGLTSVTVPSTVITLEVGAFRDMPDLTTVTIEGNSAVANFAFRTCPKLATVYLNGSDVTFTGTSMAFTHAESGVADGITIYVMNQTVADRVNVAQGSAHGYTVLVLGSDAFPAEGIIKTDTTTFSVTGKEGLKNLESVLTAFGPGEGNVVTVDLTTDIDLAGESWNTIDNMWVVFNGNGHTISNLYCESCRSGLFGYGGGVIINDLTLENVTSIGAQAGTFAGSGEGLTINNSYLKGNNIVTYQEYSGETWGGVGAITGLLMANSRVNVEIVAGTTVTLTKTGLTTEATYVDDLTGYIGANSGTVINNGTVVVNN